MATSALLEDGRFVRMDFREAGLLMAIETATLEHEPSTPIQFVALRALDARNRRMLVEFLVTGRGIRAHKESHFFLAALPRQHERVHPRRYLKRGVKDVGEGLFRCNRSPIQLQLPGIGCGNQIDGASLIPRTSGRTQNLSGVVVRGLHPRACQKAGNQEEPDWG